MIGIRRRWSAPAGFDARRGVAPDTARSGAIMGSNVVCKTRSQTKSRAVRRPAALIRCVSPGSRSNACARIASSSAVPLGSRRAFSWLAIVFPSGADDGDATGGHGLEADEPERLHHAVGHYGVAGTEQETLVGIRQPEPQIEHVGLGVRRDGGYHREGVRIVDGNLAHGQPMRPAAVQDLPTVRFHAAPEQKAHGNACVPQLRARVDGLQPALVGIPSPHLDEG